MAGDEVKPRNAAALVRLNAEGIAMLAITTGIGAGLGALSSKSRLVGAVVGGAAGFGLPVVATLLILLPLRRLTAGAPTEAL
jgi:hypothetical protein